MTEIYKWRIWCETGQRFAYLWDTVEPTRCPYDGSHVIDQSRTTIVETISNNVQSVVVEEQDLDNTRRTSGRFQATTFNIPVPSGEIGSKTSKDFIFPMPICILSAQVLTNPTMAGDFMDVSVAPDTIIGYCSQDPDPSGTVLQVSETVINNAKVGFKIEIFDETKIADLGRCVSVDKDNFRITVENPPLQEFLASSPTYVMITVEMVRQFCLFGEGRIGIGESKIGGSYVSAGTPIRLTYTNNDGKEKRFATEVEYLY